MSRRSVGVRLTAALFLVVTIGTALATACTADSTAPGSAKKDSTVKVDTVKLDTSIVRDTTTPPATKHSAPPQGAAIPTVAVAGTFSCALNATGSATCWGVTTGGAYLPPQVALPYLRFTAIAGSGSSVCGIATDGATYCWTGPDGGGVSRLTAPGAYARLIPETSCGFGADSTMVCAQANGALSTVATGFHFVYVAGGPAQDHSCGITAAQTLYCWGSNSQFAINASSTTSFSTPIQVPLPGPVTAVAAQAGGYTCAIAGGAVYCWGAASDVVPSGGGSGTPTQVTTPAPLVTLYSSNATVCGTTATNDAYCWGNDPHGELGDGLAAHPASTPPLATIVAGGHALGFISTLNGTFCGVGTDHVVYCWGEDASTSPSTPPNTLKGSSTPGAMIDLTAAPAQTVDTILPNVPALAIVVGGITSVTASARDNQGLAVASAKLQWSSSNTAVVAIDTTTFDVTGEAAGTATVTVTSGTKSTQISVTVVKPASTFSTIALGDAHACALAIDGTAYCWGSNSRGQLGDGTVVTRPTMVPVAGGLQFKSLAAAGSTTCGTTPGGATYCWGDGDSGGDTTSFRLLPGPAATLSGVLSQLTIATDVAGPTPTTVCGLDAAGTTLCWGNNFYAELGNGSGGIDSPVPVVAAGGMHFVALGGGAARFCGTTSAGDTYCWGAHSYDGFGVTADDPTPTLVASGHAFTRLAVTNNFSCGLEGGAIYCWGANDAGQLGDGTLTGHAVTVPVSGSLHFVDVVVGATYPAADAHACGLTSDGDVYCWGSNAKDELGVAPPATSYVPTFVHSIGKVSAIATSGTQICAVTAAGKPVCWGNGALPAAVATPAP